MYHVTSFSQEDTTVGIGSQIQVNQLSLKNWKNAFFYLIYQDRTSDFRCTDCISKVDNKKRNSELRKNSNRLCLL